MASLSRLNRLKKILIRGLFVCGCNIKNETLLTKHTFRSLSTVAVPRYLLFNPSFQDEAVKSIITNDLVVIPNFITEEEEASLQKEFDPYIKRRRYESSHWDDAIHGFRETEKGNWNAENTKILDRVKKIAFPSGTSPLKYVHVLDLQAEGVIKPHVDSIKFCGSTIAGLSLLTDSVMRLVHSEDKTKIIDILLTRCSLYIMRGTARYDYTHEILGNEHSKFGDEVVVKKRRVSVICRNEP